MHLKRTRLDRYISTRIGINRRDVRLMLAQGRLKIDGQLASAINQPIDQFSHVVMDDTVLQDKQPVYLMMNKPIGVVSATKDDRHRTVVDLLTRSDKHQLHIAGRLDFNSSGLLLLTNDGSWSRQLSTPETKVPKVYRVKLAKPIDPDAVDAFAKGMHFPFEGLVTRPAKLRIISEYVAEVTLMEGRYHQIKRMFGRFRNPVLELHRLSIGMLMLDKKLAPGDSRELSANEINLYDDNADTY
jgi:16S rRNA pseudouridine516 synthase